MRHVTSSKVTCNSKIEAGHNFRDNGKRYRAMINELFVFELQNVEVDHLWFQQGGATWHTAKETTNLLKETFGKRRKVLL